LFFDVKRVKRNSSCCLQNWRVTIIVGQIGNEFGTVGAVIAFIKPEGCNQKQTNKSKKNKQQQFKE